MSAALGRPPKLAGKRKDYTIYLDDSIRAAVDEYVFKTKRDNPDYSRSDFFNAAARFYLDALAREGK